MAGARRRAFFVARGQGDEAGLLRSADTRSAASLWGRGSGAMGIRTPDLLNAIEALYQLSYDPETQEK